MADKVLRSEKIVLAKKTFFLDLMMNQGGKFLKIKERRNGHNQGGDVVIIPEEGFPELVQNLESILKPGTLS